MTREPLRAHGNEAAGTALETGVDLAVLRERAGGDVALAEDVLAAMRVEVPGLFAELESAARRTDADRVRNVAHTLRGCLANVGARPVRDALEAIERASARGDREHVLSAATHALAFLEPVLRALA